MPDTKFDQKLQQMLDELPREQQPQRNLWSGIERAIALQPQQQAEAATNVTPIRQVASVGTANHALVKPLYAMAASMALVSVLWFATQQVGPGSDATSALVAGLTEQHELQKDALLASFSEQPALTENWQEQLAALDEAADAIKKALEEEPGNTALLGMLKNVHQQQIDLIERVHTPKWSQI